MTNDKPAREFWIYKGTSNFCNELWLDDNCENYIKARPEGFYDCISLADTIEGGIHVIEHGAFLEDQAEVKRLQLALTHAASEAQTLTEEHANMKQMVSEACAGRDQWRKTHLELKSALARISDLESENANFYKSVVYYQNESVNFQKVTKETLAQLTALKLENEKLKKQVDIFDEAIQRDLIPEITRLRELRESTREEVRSIAAWIENNHFENDEGDGDFYVKSTPPFDRLEILREALKTKAKDEV